MDEAGRSTRERMLTGKLHLAVDPQLAAHCGRARSPFHRYDTLDPTDGSARRAVLEGLLTHPVDPGPRRDPWEFPEPIGSPARVIRSIG